MSVLSKFLLNYCILRFSLIGSAFICITLCNLFIEIMAVNIHMPGSIIKLHLQLCIFTAISKHGLKVLGGRGYFLIRS